MNYRSVVITSGGPRPAGLAAALRQCGLEVGVVKATPAGLATEILTVAAADSNAPLGHVAVNDDGVCCSFAGPRDGTPVALPLTALRRAASFAAATASSSSATPISHRAFLTIAAQQIAHNILRPSPARPPAGTVTFLDRRTLRTSTHNVTVHPYDAPAKQRTPDEISPGRRGLAERWQLLSDSRFGAFAELDDTEFRQLPLKVTLARMSDPCGLLSVPPAVVGVGIDRESTRERAILQALAAYGSIVVDPRLLVGRNGAFLAPCDGGPSQLLRSVRNGSVDAFVRVTGLADGRERLVPAQQAFPVLRTPTLASIPCGTSAAPEWRQALTHGLLQHCVRLTVSGQSSRPRPAILAAEDFDQDPAVRFLAAMAKAAGLGFTLHDITGPAGVPVVACAPASAETVYGGGEQLAGAVREALTALLFRYQLRCDPALNAARSTAASAGWTNPADPASLSPGKLVQALTSLGHEPSVVALDHDQAVHTTFPHVLRVIV